ncbi:TolC family protein [Candidatus Ferrigenium straubiae]|jgi:outer membrane protein TolC|uniref:TolC family protein n=1 Tax=Candidatus Ferrigenium straubiae TaxID=2919506 RepID=UPI003F4AAE01
MKIRFFVGLAICGLMGVWPAHAAEERMLGSDLAGLLEYAREHNPELAATRFDADAAAQRAHSAAALPDPVLRAELMDITNQGTDKSASLWPSQAGSTRYTLMQSLPWYGKRDLKREAAEAGAEQARGQNAATWAALSAQVKSAYAQYYYVVGSQKIARELFDLVEQVEKVARVRYANGLTAQQDAVRAQVEQTSIRTGLVALDNSRRQVEARLNALLSRPATMPLAAPQGLRGIPSTASLANHAVLENRIREHNPELFMDEAGIRAGEKSRDLVFRNRYPDVLLGVSPTQSGNAVREWGVMLELNIPLQQEARRSQEREADAMLAAAKARREATVNRILSALAENLSGLDAARRMESLGSGGLLPQANVAFESALIGYQTGKVDFAALLDAARQILNAKLEILKAQTDAQMRLAEIERLLGEEL